AWATRSCATSSRRGAAYARRAARASPAAGRHSPHSFLAVSQIAHSRCESRLLPCPRERARARVSNHLHPAREATNGGARRARGGCQQGDPRRSARPSSKDLVSYRLNSEFRREGGRPYYDMQQIEVVRVGGS